MFSSGWSPLQQRGPQAETAGNGVTVRDCPPYKGVLLLGQHQLSLSYNLPLHHDSVSEDKSDACTNVSHGHRSTLMTSEPKRFMFRGHCSAGSKGKRDAKLPSVCWYGAFERGGCVCLLHASMRKGSLLRFECYLRRKSCYY